LNTGGTGIRWFVHGHRCPVRKWRQKGQRIRWRISGHQAGVACRPLRESSGRPGPRDRNARQSGQLERQPSAGLAGNARVRGRPAPTFASSNSLPESSRSTLWSGFDHFTSSRLATSTPRQTVPPSSRRGRKAVRTAALAILLGSASPPRGRQNRTTATSPVGRSMTGPVFVQPPFRRLSDDSGEGPTEGRLITEPGSKRDFGE
jgi:hypothetical protein